MVDYSGCTIYPEAHCLAYFEQVEKSRYKDFGNLSRYIGWKIANKEELLDILKEDKNFLINQSWVGCSKAQDRKIKIHIGYPIEKDDQKQIDKCIKYLKKHGYSVTKTG